jgi:hypothetical protein
MTLSTTVANIVGDDLRGMSAREGTVISPELTVSLHSHGEQYLVATYT